MSNPRLIDTYDIPYVGRVEILDSTEEPEHVRLHGNYWARVGKLGIVAGHSSTKEIALERTSEEVAVHLLKRRKELSDEVHTIDSLIPTTSLGIITSGDWLKKYKTKEDQ